MKLEVEYGFGIVVENLKFKNNYVSILMTHCATPERRTEYLEYCKDENLMPGKTESFESYADYAFGDMAYTLYQCLTEIINEYYHIHQDHRLKCEDWAIYYPERVPEDAEDKKRMFDKTQLRNMFSEFFNKILEEVPTPESLTIQY